VDTTVHGLSAVLYAFATHPDRWARLRAEPGLARVAFDEAVRWESPVQTFFRTATADVQVGDVVVPDGRKILMFLAAANRDPRRWGDPDRFDLSRDPSGHVGFGFGLHQCVGQHVARLEAEALLTALAARVKRLELVGPTVRHHNNTLRAWDSLPVRAEPTRAAGRRRPPREPPAGASSAGQCAARAGSAAAVGRTSRTATAAATATAPRTSSAEPSPPSAPVSPRTTRGQTNWPMNSAEVQTPVPRPRCSKVSEPSAQVRKDGSSRPLPKPVRTAKAVTIGTFEARARPTRPIPDNPKARGTVTPGPSLASRPNRKAPTAVSSEAMALTAPMVPVDWTPMLSSLAGAAPATFGDEQVGQQRGGVGGNVERGRVGDHAESSRL
jgi:cytochrome P450